MDKTGIEWTDATWNPTRGCRRISPGCVNCYAEDVATRFCGPGLPYEGLITLGRWNGKARFVPDKLDLPLRWRKSRRIFVNSMSDLFYDGFSDEQIDQVLAVMLLAPQHTFQVLTKRAERMARYLSDPGLYMRILAGPASELRQRMPRLMAIGISNPAAAPAKWIWWGVSVEDQQRADERIPHLLQTPAAVRFVSYEPALGPVNFGLRPMRDGCGPKPIKATGLDWLIVGGESGTGARPFDIAWAHAAVAQCRAAGVPVFVKQMGAQCIATTPYMPRDAKYGAPPQDGLRDRWPLITSDPKGGDMADWPADLRVREWPRGVTP